jgi:hypothetical protein
MHDRLCRMAGQSLSDDTVASLPQLGHKLLPFLIAVPFKIASAPQKAMKPAGM